MYQCNSWIASSLDKVNGARVGVLCPELLEESAIECSGCGQVAPNERIARWVADPVAAMGTRENAERTAEDAKHRSAERRGRRGKT